MNRRSLSDQALYSSAPIKKTVYEKPSYSYNHWTVIFLVIGLIDIFSAAWMLIAPAHWYYNIPGGLLVGGFFLIEFSLPLFPMNTVFYILHMFVHIHEIVSGRLKMGMFWTDLPGIYVPALVTLGLNIVLIKNTWRHLRQKATK